MISDFIWIELIEQTENHIICSCSLPDPDLDSDEDMLVCGKVECVFGINDENDTLKIMLFDNFKDLCVGDFYQRKNFVQTIILVLNMKYQIEMQDANIVFVDCWGEYSGNLSSID